MVHSGFNILELLRDAGEAVSNADLRHNGDAQRPIFNANKLLYYSLDWFLRSCSGVTLLGSLGNPSGKICVSKSISFDSSLGQDPLAIDRELGLD